MRREAWKPGSHSCAVLAFKTMCSVLHPPTSCRGDWEGGLHREGESSCSERGPNLIQRRGEVTSGPLSHVRDLPRPAPCRPVMGAGNAEPKWQVPPL